MKYLCQIILIIFIFLDSSATSVYSVEGLQARISIDQKEIVRIIERKKGAEIKLKVRLPDSGKRLKFLTSSNGKKKVKLKIPKGTNFDIDFLNEKKKKEAREDITNGKIYIKTFCGPLIMEKDRERQRKLSRLTERYGFQYLYIVSCTFWSNEDYNKVVRDHLTQRNGEGWWKKFLAEKARMEDESEHVPLYEL